MARRASCVTAGIRSKSSPSNGTFLDVAYLLLHGELPDKAESDEWTEQITHHTFIHENIKKFIDGFHHDAHPMGILVSTVGALSTFYPDAKDVSDDVRQLQMIRLMAKMPTLAAFAYRHAMGLPYAYPDNDLSYTGNFLNMMWKSTEPKYRPNPVLEHALDVLFILHADHEQNCSTTRCAPSAARTPTRTPPQRRPPRRCTARCTAGRMSRFSGCSPRSGRSTRSRATSSG